MSDTLIAFLAALGAGAWVYSKMYRSTGGNTKNALVAAGGAGLLLFLAALTILKAIF